MKYTALCFRFLVVVLLVVGVTLYTAPQVDAQSRRGSGRDRESGALQRQIDALGEDVVESLPIPVLFGATPETLYPNFGDPRGGGTRQHEGHDTMAERGTPVVSPTRAIVTRIGNGSSAGIFVNTANPGGESFVYMHLDETADIRVGDELEVGDLIGFVGSTGNADDGAPHLHFEIRDGRTPLDPYPRLAREFTPSEKARFLDRMLEDMSSREQDEFIEFLVEEYSSELIRMRALGANLPREIESVLPGGAQGSPASIQRDLDIGMTGEDVRALQVLLIGKGYLSADSATGYFGPLTQAAVMNYQREKSISPVSGYVGPLTRAALSSEMGGATQTAGMTQAEMRARIRELQNIVEGLIRELERRQGA